MFPKIYAFVVQTECRTSPVGLMLYTLLCAIIHVFMHFPIPAVILSSLHTPRRCAVDGVLILKVLEGSGRRSVDRV